MWACLLRAGEFVLSSSLLFTPLPAFDTPLSKSSLHHCQNANAHTSHSSPSPFAPLFRLLTAISHRLKQPLSPCLSLFLGSNFALLPFHDLFFVSSLFRRLPAVRPVSPPYFSQSVSQSSSRLSPAKRLGAKQLSLWRLIQRDCCFFLLSP